MVDRVVCHSGNVDADAVPRIELEGLAFASGANQDIGACEVGLQELEPGGETFRIGREHVGDDVLVRVVVRVHFASEQDLSRVAHALDGMGFLFRFAQRG